jgi:predicted nucleic acid-binding protein
LLTLDSGGLTAVARNEEDARAAFTNSVRTSVGVIVPAVVIAESTRGDAQDARVNHVLNQTRVVAAREEEARLAARLKSAAGMAGVEPTIDALVVATAALAGGGAVLTSDPTDIESLCEALQHPTVRAIRV